MTKGAGDVVEMEDGTTYEWQDPITAAERKRLLDEAPGVVEFVNKVRILERIPSISWDRYNELDTDELLMISEYAGADGEIQDLIRWRQEQSNGR